MSLRSAFFTIVVLAIAAGAAGIAVAGSELDHPNWRAHTIKAPNKDFPIQDLASGFWFRTKETQAIQEDDFNNPGFLGVERGEALWSKPDGAAGKSCASCHGDAAISMKGVGAAMPKWNVKQQKPVDIEQQINICRTERMAAEPWRFGSDELTSMTAYLRNQSRGMPVKLDVDGPMAPWLARGKTLYYTRVGQLDLACASCHERNHGKFLRADFLSQGQSNDFPTYRLSDQHLVTFQERMQGCIFDVRGIPYEPFSDDAVALELYVAWRGTGLPVETPGVRN